MELFARSFAARMMGNFVVCAPDADYYWTESGDWSGQTLRASIHPLQLVTIHPEIVYDCKSLQERNPKYWAQPYPLRMTRSGGYWSMLSGVKGLTYGCGGVCFWGCQKNEAIGGGWTPLEPDKALYKPSSDQMTYFFEMFSSIDWWRLEPAHDVILNQPPAPVTMDDPAWLRRMVMAKTPNGDLGVAYLPDNAQIKVAMAAFSRFSCFFPCQSKGVTTIYGEPNSPWPAEAAGLRRKAMS